MTTLQWRSATRDDRHELQLFECAERGRRHARNRWKPEYPRPWEFEVQSAVRELRPPMRPPRFVLVGLDEHGIGAVSYRSEVGGPEQVHLELMAVANRLRRTPGYSYGEELAVQTIDEILDRAITAEVGHILVTAHVHPRNKNSQQLCERMGFEQTGVADSGYEVWSGELFPDI